MVDEHDDSIIKKLVALLPRVAGARTVADRTAVREQATIQVGT